MSKRSFGENGVLTSPLRDGRDGASALPKPPEIRNGDGNRAWVYVQALAIDEELPPWSHIVRPCAPRVVLRPSVNELSQRDAFWGDVLREALGKDACASAVTYVPELDVICMAVGTTVYFWKRERPFRTAQSVSVSDDVCSILSVKSHACVLVWTSQTVVLCRLDVSKGNAFTIRNGVLTVELPTRPTAVVAASTERIFFGGENGRVYELVLSVCKWGTTLQGKIRCFTRATDYWFMRLRGFSTGAIRSLAFSEGHQRLIVLHTDSELEVLSEDGHVLGRYYDESVELFTIVVAPTEASQSQLSLLGASSNGELYELEMPRRAAIKLKQRGRSLAEAIQRSRNEVVRLLAFSGGKLLVTVTDIGQSPPLTKIQWLYRSLSQNDKPVMAVETVEPSLLGQWHSFSLAPSPKWSCDVWDQISDLSRPVHPLTQQFFDSASSFVICTSDGCVEVRQEWLHVSVLSALSTPDVLRLDPLLDLYGEKETVASTVLLALGEDHWACHKAMQHAQLKPALVDGIYIAFKRLLSPLWKRGLFKFEGGVIQVAIQCTTLQWYLRMLQRFLDALEALLDNLPSRNCLAIGWPLESIRLCDYDAILFLKYCQPFSVLRDAVVRLLTERCLGILEIVQELRRCSILKSTAVLLYRPLFSTLLHDVAADWLHDVATDWRCLFREWRFWSLEELSKTPRDASLAILLEALVWRGWYPERETLIRLNSNAQLFLNHISWEQSY